MLGFQYFQTTIKTQTVIKAMYMVQKGQTFRENKSVHK